MDNTFVSAIPGVNLIPGVGTKVILNAILRFASG